MSLATLWPEHNFPVTLAPMVGLSHVVLRQVVASYMPKNAITHWPTEMLNSRRIPTQNVGQTPETLTYEGDQLLVPQILGNQERFITPTVQKLVDYGARGIDINMGCPVRKALKHNYGVALMGDINYASEVVKMTCNASKVPVTLKLRVGLQKDDDYFMRFNEKMIDSGVRLITLHPRTAEQKRRGNADWGQIKRLKECFDIPIVGNGDIQVYQDVFDMLELTGCDAVMVGRALCARPWMMWQIGEKLGFLPPKCREADSCPFTSSEEAYEYGVALKLYCQLCFKYFGAGLSKRKINFYLKVSSVWLNFGHSLCKKLAKCNQLNEYEDVIDDFFSKNGLQFSQKTQLTY